MSDLISREKAIAETWREPRYTDPLNVLTEIRDRLRNLPSAKPETHDNARETHACVSPCDVCRHYPPSSTDGKPCSMCPAEPTEQVRTYISLADCVSRQAAIDAVCSVCGDTECNIFDPDNKAKLYCPEPYAIMQLPSAEPERKTGHWIEHYGDSKCSECGYILKIYDTNYCPNCGAKMEGENDG